MSNFKPAPEVCAIAADLIRAHHPHLANPDVAVVFLFAEKPKKTKGKTALGWAQKVGNMAAHFGGTAIQQEKERREDGDDPDDEEEEFGTPVPEHRELGHVYGGEDFEVGDDFFVVCIHEGSWRFGLSPKQRVALVDHELCHLYVTEDEKAGAAKLSLLPHDLEEFAAVVKRHGPWLGDVAQILKAAKEGPQLTLEEISDRSVPADIPPMSAIDAGMRRFASALANDREVTSLTISGSGMQPVTITSDDAARIVENIDKEQGRRRGNGNGGGRRAA